MEEGYGDDDTLNNDDDGGTDEITVPFLVEINEPTTQDVIKELHVMREPDTFTLTAGTNTRPNHIKINGTFQRIGEKHTGATCLELRAILVMIFKDGKETIENLYRETFVMRSDSNKVRWVQHSQYINRRTIEAPISWRITMCAASVEGNEALIRLVMKTTLRTKSKSQIKYLKKKFERRKSIKTSLATYYPNSTRLKLSQSEIRTKVKSDRKRNIYLFKRRFEVYLLGRDNDTITLFTTNEKTRMVRQVSILVSSTAYPSGDGVLAALYVNRGNPDIIQPGETSRRRFLGQVNTTVSMKGELDAYQMIYTKNLILSKYDSLVMSYDKDSENLVYATVTIYFSKKLLEKRSTDEERGVDIDTVI